MSSRLVAAAVAGAVVLMATDATAAEAASGASVSGVLFDDQNRNGQRDAGEPGFGNRTIQVIDEASGYPVAGAGTAADGSYVIDGLQPGSYRVEVGTTDWWALRSDWVPTTTGSVWFRHDGVALTDGPAIADFGLRSIVRSAAGGSPITATTGTSGVRVESYVDAISAAEVLAALESGTLLGGEAPTTTVRFGLDSTDYTATSVNGSPGTFSAFSATVYTSYLSWLDGVDSLLVHEYGHAWANYHDRIVQQDGTYAGYLEARGLTGDSRLGSGHAWSVDELIAEDYRQLFGTPTAASVPQENQDLPAASDVPGLETYLRDVFTQAPDGSDGSTGGGSGTEQPPAPTPLTVSDLTVSGTATPTVTIGFGLSRDAVVEISITDRRGRTVRSLLGNQQTDGAVSVVWDRLDSRGRQVSDGDYTFAVVAESGSETASAVAVATLTSPANDAGDSTTTDGSGGSKGGGKGANK